MKHRKKRNFKPILIIALIVIPIILLNMDKIYEKTYGMLDSIIRPVKETSTGLNQSAGNRYSESDITSELYKEFDKKGSDSTSPNEVSISYEEVKRNANLFMAEKGILPWKKYDSITGYFTNTKDEDKKILYRSRAIYDATLESWEVPGANNKDVSNIPSNLFASTTNNFGKNEGQTVATSRTIAKYKYGNLKTDLNAGISYILAHNKSTQFDVDKVQQALWLMRYAANEDIDIDMSGTEADEFILEKIGTEYIGLNRQAAVLAANLFIEAKTLQDYMNERSELEAANNGQEIVDNMANKYKTGQAGIVSYSTEKSEFMVGPFSFNYIRKVLVPKEGANSEAINEDGIIVISAINDAKLYGIVKNAEGKYVEELLTDWEFVYTDATYSKREQKAIRNYETQAINSGDVTPNIYPYPNETFYLKIKSPDVEAITRIEFGMDSLNATSEVYELSGTYSNVNWVVAKNSNQYYLKGEESSNRPKAATLYQLKSAKIVSEHKTVSLSLGYEQTVRISLGYEESDYKDLFSGICIPLTTSMGGRVWYDGTEVQEKNGELDAIYTEGGDKTEPGIENVKVYLYDLDGNLVQTTTTSVSGRYQFNYVKVGKKYYITFEYDGMKYKPSQLLGGYSTIDNYTENMSGYQNMSHAIEDANERLEFNKGFYEITEDKAISVSGKSQSVSYTYNRYNEGSDQGMGTIAKVQEFPITASTKTAKIIYPLHNNYIISNVSNEILQNGDKNQANLDDLYYLIGINYENEFYYVTSSPATGSSLTNSTLGTKFTKSLDCLNNINLGLIERDSSDFAIKNDITQTIYTLNELVSNANINPVGEKLNNGFDISDRKENYYYSNYVQPLGYDEYSWRSSYMDNAKLLENDELQLYVQYKLTIKNQSNLLSGYLTEIVDYYDKELYYPVDSNEVWRYYDKNTNYMDNENGYADVVMPQLTRYTSWAIKNNGQDSKQELGQVEWKSTSRYGNKNNADNLNKMYTTSLEKTRLAPGDEIDIFIIFKVERVNIDGKEGLYIANDNADIGKQNIAEINGYRALNYDGTVGGRIDQDSNPGNSSIENVITYEDDIDSAPYLRVTVNAKDNGKGISGYVWEDSRENGLGVTLTNNQIVGNGIIDRDSRNNIIENFVNNVQVELVRMEYNKETGQYEEVSFAEDYEERSGNKIIKYTGPQATGSSNSEYEITTGMYRFDNLVESGTYKIRFTYGTETQLRNFVNIKNADNSVKYNGQDYKSTEYAGPLDLSTIENPDTKIAIVVDCSTSISKETLENIKTTISTLRDNLKNLNKNIEITVVNYAQEANIVDDIRKITSTPGDNLAEGLQLAINSLNKETASGQYAGNRVMVVFSDGFANSTDVAKTLMKRSLEAGIKIVGVGIEGANTDTFKVTTKYNGNDAQVIYYNLVNEKTYTTDKLYNLIRDYMVKHLILVTDRSHATDYLENDTIITDTKSKYVTGRLQVMQYSQKMIAENGDVLNTDYINSLERDIKQNSEWSKAIRKLAEKTQMTADSYLVSINFEDNTGVTKQINLGLQEIPKSQIEVNDQIDDIIVTLSNNQKIISLKDKVTQNVQIIPESIYSIYLDEELMQGTKIDVIYKISVSNISEVDSLWIYLRHEDFATKKYFYEQLYKTLYNEETRVDSNMSEAEFDELLYNAIPIRVIRLYNYYDNLIFRAEENNNWQIINNTVQLDENNIARDTYGNILFTNESSDRRYMRDETAMWSATNIPNVIERVKERVDRYSVIETTSFKNIELYPTISTIVRDNAAVSSLSTFVKFSKTLAAQDVDDKYSLQYMNYTEINATESLTGRRDYEGAVGDYEPGEPDTQRDTSASEKIIILPPFGMQPFMYGIIISLGLILVVGIVIIKRKFLK